MTAARLTRHVLNRERDFRKPIWVTETTFPAAKGDVPATQEGLAAALVHDQERDGVAAHGALQAGAVNARRLKLRRIYWYTWASSYKGRDDLFDYSGLVSVGDDGASTAQPALLAYRRARGS